MTKARDLSKLLSTANGKIAGANLDVSFENISDTGTAGTKVASGTTNQRGSTAGQIRFNTTTGLAEYYTGTEFKVIDTAPTVTAVSPLEVDSTAGGNITFTITGSSFGSGAVAKFIGNDATEITASTTTVNSSSSISAVIARSSFVNAKEPYDVRVLNTSGLAGTLDNQISVDTSPAWSTASGSLGSFDEEVSINVSATATDADGDTIVYSVQSGTLPTGLSLNSSTGAITGTAGSVNANTTSSFTLRATANSKTADRAFSILIQDVPFIPQSSLVYDFRANDFSGSAGTLSDGTNLSSCLLTRGVNSSNQFSAEVEFGSVGFVTNDSYALNGKAFTLNGNGQLEINVANSTIANTYWNSPPSVSWVMWFDWDGSSRSGAYSRYGEIDHFNHMMDSTTQFHYNQGFTSGNFANGTWQRTSGNQWQHLVITYNHTTGDQIYYIDGSVYGTVNVGTNSGVGMNRNNNSVYPHALGGRTDGFAGEKYTGRIAEARYYTRVLTASEVTREWNGTKANFART
jgi:hypothetical protein